MDTKSILINIACSVTASIIAVIILPLIYRSNIGISPEISKAASSYGEGVCHYFKIVNQSIYSAYDLTLRLDLISRVEVSGNFIMRTTSLSLVANQVAVVIGWRPWPIKHSDDNCLRFRTLNDISALLADPNNSISLTVTSRHPLTGFVGSHTQTYRGAASIKDGFFAVGQRFDILP